MLSLKRAVSSVVQRGRIGRKKSFVVAVVVALMALPVAEALAYFGATGSGSIANVQGGTATSTVTFATTGVSTYVFKDSTGTVVAGSMPLGGSVSVPLTVTCTAAPPCTVATLTLTGWSADAGHAGCTSAAFPGSFSISGVSPALPQSIATLNGTTTLTPTIVWANLGALNQGPCSGATFTFNIATP